jgi:catechol 2,3-dioxygenase-like lactoylglutathione lyase family enzyme
MGTLTGVNHIATVSKDLDSLIDFYGRVFGAKVLADDEVPQMVLRSKAGRGRHVMIEIGGPGFLHAWQIEGVDPSVLDDDIFERGRVDHFSWAVGSYSDFEHFRQKLIAEGASTGEINDFGVMLSFSFRDPDGLWSEVSWWKDGPDLSDLDMSLMKDPIAEKAQADGS